MDITEKQLEAQVKGLAKLFGYIYYHTHRSQFSPAGFPDCVMGRLEPEPKLIFAELKTGTNQPTIEQYAWLCLIQHLSPLTNGIVDAFLWYPEDFEEIAEILR